MTNGRAVAGGAEPGTSPPWDPQKLEAQEQRARRLKEKLRSKRQSLRRQLERLRGPAGPRADGLDSSGLSSERSDSDRGECPEAKGSCGLSGPRPLTGGLPVQRRQTWTWRAWRPGPRLSCCGASARAGSTATPTAAAAGCEPPARCPPLEAGTRREPQGLPATD